MSAMPQTQPTDLVYIRALVHERHLDPRVKSNPTWWRPDGGGYTNNLHQAGLYTRERAQREQESTHGNHAVTEIKTAYLLPMPETDFGSAMTMVDDQDPNNITFMAYNEDVIGASAGIYWGRGSYLNLATFSQGVAKDERIEVRPWWLVNHRWRVVPVDAIKWIAEVNSPQPTKAPQ
jgi:hypothetical protein